MHMIYVAVFSGRFNKLYRSVSSAQMGYKFSTVDWISSNYRHAVVPL